jgi:hypothetical protein
VGWLNSGQRTLPKKVVSIPTGESPNPIAVEIDLPTSRPGFDRSAVEQLIGLGVSALEQDAAGRQRATAALRSRTLPVRSRGYDREAVNALLNDLMKQLGT